MNLFAIYRSVEFFAIRYSDLLDCSRHIVSKDSNFVLQIVDCTGSGLPMSVSSAETTVPKRAYTKTVKRPKKDKT